MAQATNRPTNRRVVGARRSRHREEASANLTLRLRALTTSRARVVGTGSSILSRGVGDRRSTYSLAPARWPGARVQEGAMHLSPPLIATEGGRQGDTCWHSQPSPGGVARQSHLAPFSVGCGTSGALGRSRSRGQAGSNFASLPGCLPGGSPRPAAWPAYRIAAHWPAGRLASWSSQSARTPRVLPLPFGHVWRCVDLALTRLSQVVRGPFRPDVGRTRLVTTQPGLVSPFCFLD